MKPVPAWHIEDTHVNKHNSGTTISCKQTKQTSHHESPPGRAHSLAAGGPSCSLWTFVMLTSLKALTDIGAAVEVERTSDSSWCFSWTGTVVCVTVGLMISIHKGQLSSCDISINVQRTFFDNGLDRFMQVVVHMLASDCRLLRLRLDSGTLPNAVLVLCLFSLNLLLGSLGVVVLDLAMLCRRLLVLVLGRLHLLVRQGLDCGVVVVLVRLLLNDWLQVLLMGLGNGVMLHRRGDFRVDRCVLLTSPLAERLLAVEAYEATVFLQEVVDGGGCCVHSDVLIGYESVN